jgi:hypothetical protein
LAEADIEERRDVAQTPRIVFAQLSRCSAYFVLKETTARGGCTTREIYAVLSDSTHARQLAEAIALKQQLPLVVAEAKQTKKPRNTNGLRKTTQIRKYPKIPYKGDQRTGDSYTRAGGSGITARAE